LRKHTATLKKHSGAAWLSGIRARLALVEHELDARDGLGVHSPPLTSYPALTFTVFADEVFYAHA
jgi:hypothetical protein